MSDFKIKKDYRNVFHECGIDESRIDKRVCDTAHEFFYGDDRVYFEAGNDMSYITDTGNNDVRTEGMSYGMMMCVQLDMQPEFDRLWKWTKTYMYLTEGENEGYFAWSCNLDGSKRSDGPAPDGEEFFAMALFFASHRWGDRDGIFDYSHQAREILRACLHKGENGRPGEPMWNRDNYQILFVPGCPFTDPSYHLPHFYELFREWCYEEDREFFDRAVKASREYLVKACHPVSGFSSEYANFDGTPRTPNPEWATERHDWFFSDAYRTAANIGLDYEWFGIDVGQKAAADNIQRFLDEDAKNDNYRIYEVDGTPIECEPRHPVAITATVAQASLAADNETTREWVMRFWNMPMRKGEKRYYDNCLYMFAMLALSGRYRMW